MKKFVEKDVAENPLYHDTWKLLKKYRDVVWSLEISVQWAILNSLGFIMSYIVPFFEGGQWAG